MAFFPGPPSSRAPGGVRCRSLAPPAPRLSPRPREPSMLHLQPHAAWRSITVGAGMCVRLAKHKRQQQTPHGMRWIMHGVASWGEASVPAPQARWRSGPDLAAALAACASAAPREWLQQVPEAVRRGHESKRRKVHLPGSCLCPTPDLQCSCSAACCGLIVCTFATKQEGLWQGHRC